jgi:hypothetical protein
VINNIITILIPDSLVGLLGIERSLSICLPFGFDLFSSVCDLVCGVVTCNVLVPAMDDMIYLHWGGEMLPTGQARFVQPPATSLAPQAQSLHPSKYPLGQTRQSTVEVVLSSSTRDAAAVVAAAGLHLGVPWVKQYRWVQNVAPLLLQPQLLHPSSNPFGQVRQLISVALVGDGAGLVGGGGGGALHRGVSYR